MHRSHGFVGWETTLRKRIVTSVTFGIRLPRDLAASRRALGLKR